MDSGLLQIVEALVLPVTQRLSGGIAGMAGISARPSLRPTPVAPPRKPPQARPWAGAGPPTTLQPSVVGAARELWQGSGRGAGHHLGEGRGVGVGVALLLYSKAWRRRPRRRQRRRHPPAGGWAPHTPCAPWPTGGLAPDAPPPRPTQCCVSGCVWRLYSVSCCCCSYP